MTTLTVMTGPGKATVCPATHTTSVLATSPPRRCELDAGHIGPHRTTTPLGEPFHWHNTVGRHAR